MDLGQHLADIRAGLIAGRFLNEASVSQGVVLRVLQAVGWPVFDARRVWPEYTVEDRRVDFALCHPAAKPAVFVEVKQPGNTEAADRQLFEYAFHLGIPMAVLTDGQQWHFYLPAERGGYDERRVYKLDLVERELEESAKRLTRYLSYSAVCSGEALEAARADYRNIARKREIRATLPRAWTALVDEQDSLLLDLLADKVESLCGYKPDADVVADFVSKVLVLEGSRPAPPRASAPAHPPKRGSRGRKRSGGMGFLFRGKSVEVRSAREALIRVLEHLAESDPQFLERFAARPKHGRRRRFVAKRREDLYPGREDLAREHAHELVPGWWVGTNYGKSQIKKILRIGCEVAGLKFGQDLVLHID